MLCKQDDITLFAKGRYTYECVYVARKTETRELETAKDCALRRGLKRLSKSTLDSDTRALSDVLEKFVLTGTTYSSTSIKNA